MRNKRCVQRRKWGMKRKTFIEKTEETGGFRKENRKYMD